MTDSPALGRDDDGLLRRDAVIVMEGSSGFPVRIGICSTGVEDA